MRVEGSRSSWISRRGINPAAVLAAGLMVLSACTSSGSDDATGGSDGPGDCVAVYVAASPEKIQLMSDLALQFTQGDHETADGDCIYVEVQSVSSGLGAQLLADEWNESSDGPRPVIWSPASSAWGAIVNQQRDEQGRAPVVGDGTPFMVTPLVIAMPESMAAALGWPDTPIGWSDILDLATSEEGWGRHGHPEWGEFRLGKTNPNFSTSGLSALIAQSYAGAGKTDGLSTEDLARPNVVEFGQGVESAVVHYGDTTMTFLNNWFTADQRGAAMMYVSAAAVEEKSVIDYNMGNPDGRLDPGEVPRPPREKLVAIYPSEGTLYSDNPLFVVQEEWVSPQQADAAQAFIDFLQLEENQVRVLEFGFRPGNLAVPISDPISLEYGVDPDQPQSLLGTPEPHVMSRLLEVWGEQRKGTRVTLLVDVSGSMGDSAGGGQTKLDLAKEAILASLDEFSPDDEVSLVTFTTQGTSVIEPLVVELVPNGTFRQNRNQLESVVQGLRPQWGTPLYDAISVTYTSAVENYDSSRINAIVVLSDGANDDGTPSDDQTQYNDLITQLSQGSEGQLSKPVRVFTIAYGSGASQDVLGNIAQAASSAAYDASDPRSINKVFAEVISNF